ncbi:BMP family protein [Gaopeijia maritima]|uniref:BMP family protein n=1 Tax=Gaopeijia maritima TaxID=3119007 RepID=UPI003253F81B
MIRGSGFGRVASVTLAVVALVACGGGESAAGDSAADDGRLRVALLTAGPVSDAGWYAGAYEGLLLIEDSLQAEVSHQQTRTPTEFDEAFLAYGSEGYDLVFAHGYEYQDAAMRAGPQFPDMSIVVSGGGRIGENVAPLVFSLWEGSYLAGMAAGGITRSGVVGMVGGVAIPPAVGTFRAFEAGVRAVRPDAEILEAFTGSWEDVAGAKEAAVAQISRGADVIIHNTDGGSFGVFQAAREATMTGDTVWALGMNRDQNDVAPDVILGSAVIRVPAAFISVAAGLVAGERPGGAPIYEGAAQGVVDFVPNPQLLDRYPAGLIDRIRAAGDSVRAGTLEVPAVPFVDGEAG